MAARSPGSATATSSASTPIAGTLDVLVDAARIRRAHAVVADLSDNDFGMGRELFAAFRRNVGPADHGASVFS